MIHLFWSLPLDFGYRTRTLPRSFMFITLEVCNTHIPVAIQSEGALSVLSVGMNRPVNETHTVRNKHGHLLGI